MKTNWTLILLLAISISVYSQKKAVIKFDKFLYDYGQIKEEKGKATGVFNFTNTGTDTLKILKVEPSCSCISADWTKTPVLPGQKGSVTAYYDPFHREGKFEKSLWVNSNATEPKITLSIKGEVIPKVKTIADSFPERNGNLWMSSRFFALRNIPITMVKHDSLLVYNAGTSPMTFSFTDCPSYVSVKAVPAKLDPKKKGKFLISYDAKKKNEYGLVYDNITCVTNDSVNADKRLTINATITDDFSRLTEAQLQDAPKIKFTADVIDYGTVNEGEVVKRTFDFANLGKDPLIIRKAAPNKEDCKVSVSGSPAAGGANGTIDIEFDTKGSVGDDVRRTVLMVTNDPSRSFVILVIKGKITRK